MKYLNLNISKRRKVSSLHYNGKLIWMYMDIISVPISAYSGIMSSLEYKINLTELTDNFKSKLETILNKKSHIPDAEKELLLESEDMEEYLLNLTTLLL